MSHEEEAMFHGIDFHTSKEITLNDAGPDSIDNVIFYYLVPVDPNNKNKMMYLSKFLAEYTSKIRRLAAEHNINDTKRYIKQTNSNKEGEQYKQCIQVALPGIQVNDVFRLITNEEAISFNDEYMSIKDIDITEDITGVITIKRLYKP